MPPRALKSPGFTDYLAAAALVVAATGVAAAGRAFFDLADIVMLYVSAIMVAAVAKGRRPALLASALSVAAYDLFFVPPFYTFRVADLGHLITFSMMFIVGWLISSLTARIREQELAAQTEEVRSALLSAVSHDLRTPLAAITGSATTLRESMDGLSVDERAELLEAICEEAERLERLVANLLDMTRLDSGAIEVHREWIPLEEVVGSALNRLDEKLGSRNVSVERDLPLVSVDPVLFEQVLVNLLENIAKYTPADSPVEIGATRVNGAVELSIRDRGPGLEPGSEARVFEKFFRGSNAGVRGAGLGLAVVRGIVTAHGGVVRAANRSGGGLDVRVRVPARGAPPPAEAAGP